jgi:hypothetical protein
MDAQTIAFYRDIFSDLTVDREEAAELTTFLQGLNAPPDKVVWLRANAFKTGCEFLSDDRDANVALLRTVNFVVHAIEKTCMEYVRRVVVVVVPSCVMPCVVVCQSTHLSTLPSLSLLPLDQRSSTRRFHWMKLWSQTFTRVSTRTYRWIEKKVPS